MRQIKKYANRKLYDTTDKTYISMHRLSELIRQGEDVVIIDNETGRDLTASTVSSLIARSGDTTETAVSPGILIQLLRRGGSAVTDATRKYATLWQKSFTLAEDELDAIMKKYISNREISLSEAHRLKKEIAKGTQSMKAWIRETIDIRIREMLGVMNLASGDDMADLNERIRQLTDKIEALEQCYQRDPSDRHG